MRMAETTKGNDLINSDVGVNISAPLDWAVCLFGSLVAVLYVPARRYLLVC